MNRELRALLGFLLSLGLGIGGAVLLAHFAACEQYEAFCSLGK